MKGNAGSLFKRLGKIIPGHMEVLGDGFDLQTAVKIHMYEVDASVNQGAVACGNRVFLYLRDKLKRLFAENPDEIPVAGTTTAAWVFTPEDSVYETAQGTVPITVNRAEPAVAAAPTVAGRTYHPDAALTDSDLIGGSVKHTIGGVHAG